MTSSLFPDHDCRDHIIYHVGGEYTCLHESHGFSDGVYFFTDFGFTSEEVANEFYPDWNKPDGKEYGFDIEMKEYFDQCVKDGTHYHPLEKIKN
jgi:hypothetical protein